MDTDLFIGSKALYTALRLNWLQDPTLVVEDWQVEDYREIPYSVLFERLRTLGIPLDRVSFLTFVNQTDPFYDSPEELCSSMVEGKGLQPIQQDQIYLVIFELWRRLVTDKPCLTIFCDELDYQIYLYDQGEVDNSEALQDALANLQIILEEDTDQGGDPKAIFSYVGVACAHDIEVFLLDYIAEQIDEANFNYAGELLEGFFDYLPPSHWLEFLKARLLWQSDPRAATRLIKHLLDEEEGDEGLDFYLELLHFLVHEGDQHLCERVFAKSIDLLQNEEDLQDLLGLCIEYHQARDHDENVRMLQQLLNERRTITAKPSQNVLSSSDPALALLKKIML